MLNLGTTFPNFSFDSTEGKHDFYEYLGDSWGILFSHPADYTPVCTTEIARLAQLRKEFDARNVKVMCISVDSVDDHLGWREDVKKYSGCEVPFPLIADVTGEISTKIGMLEEGGDKMQTVRAVFVIGPDKKVKAIISYPTSCGRNFDEVLRLIDSLQLTAANPSIVTPVDWKKGGDVIVKPGAEVEGAQVIDLPSGRPYLKFLKGECLNKK